MTSKAYRENFKQIEWRPLPPIARKPRSDPKRSHLPAPLLAIDTMEPVQSQATGKVYDSKSALRREYRELGMIEVGNDPARLRPPERKKPDRRKINETLQKAESRVKRGERSDPSLKNKTWD